VKGHHCDARLKAKRLEKDKLITFYALPRETTHARRNQALKAIYKETKNFYMRQE
jgi:hypothetical protein